MGEQPMIVDQEYDPAISVRRLKQHPKNPRRGDDSAVGDSIERTGFYGAILVQRKTNYVLAGHTRLRAMKEHGATTVPGFWIRCDEQTATDILLSDNLGVRHGDFDNEQLLELLQEQMSNVGDLVGTGYSLTDMADLVELRAPIVHESAAIDDLHPHPQNYQEHPADQLAHIAASIEEHGFYRNVVVARGNVILAGHGVVLAAQSLGRTRIPVIRLDVEADEPRAMKVLASDNEISNLAIVDDRALTDMLKDIMQSDELIGTGFDEEQVAALLMVTRSDAELKAMNANDEWVGLPDFNPADKSRKLIIHFDNNEDRERFVDEYELAVKRRFASGVWATRWPNAEISDQASVKFVVPDEER